MDEFRNLNQLLLDQFREKSLGVKYSSGAAVTQQLEQFDWQLLLSTCSSVLEQDVESQLPFTMITFRWFLIQISTDIMQHIIMWSYCRIVHTVSIEGDQLHPNPPKYSESFQICPAKFWGNVSRVMTSFDGTAHPLKT